MAYKKVDTVNETEEEIKKEEVEPDYETLYLELQRKHNRLLSVEVSYQQDIDKLNSEIDTLLNIRMELLNRCDELKKQLEEREQLQLLTPLETANFLIHDTFKRKTSNMEKVFLGNSEYIEELRYNVDELEQIAEHLLIYCKHNKEVEE